MLDRAMTDLTRACVVTAFNKLNPNTRYPRDHWSDDESFRVTQVLKAASTPATTSTTGWAKEMAPISIALRSNLVPFSAAAGFLLRADPLTFDGGTVNIPALSMPLGDFVKQGDPIPVVNGTVALQASLSPSKLAVIVALTREMVESSNAEVLVRTALMEALGPSLDRRFFDNVAAVADTRPAGILNGITPLTAATGGGADAMTSDLAKLAGAVAAKAGNGGWTFIAAPKQAVAIGLYALRDPGPVLISTTVPDKTVIAIANNGVVFAADDPAIDTTNAASWHADTAPGPIGSTPIVHTAFQKDVLGLRLKWPIAWAVRDAGAIAIVQNTTWPA